MERLPLRPALSLISLATALACGESSGGTEAEALSPSGMPSAVETSDDGPSAGAPAAPLSSEPVTPAPPSTSTAAPDSVPDPSPTSDPAPASTPVVTPGSGGAPGGPSPAAGSGPGGAGAAAGSGGTVNAAGAENAGAAGDAGEGGRGAGGLGSGGGDGNAAGAAGMGAGADAIATATLASTGVDPGHDDISGSATFTQIGDAVTLVLELEDCPMGPHVSHIHVTPDCGNEGNAAGNHWLPNGELLDDYVCDAEGNASYTLTVQDGQWTIGAGDESTDVDGHAFMVHIGSSVSPGDRVACGIIERQ